MSTDLKLVILYDARNNTYAICGHDLSADEADRQVAEWRAKQLPAFVVSQKARHYADEPEACWTCRRDVESAFNLEPKPKIQRRIIP